MRLIASTDDHHDQMPAATKRGSAACFEGPACSAVVYRGMSQCSGCALSLFLLSSSLAHAPPPIYTPGCSAFARAGQHAAWD